MGGEWAASQTARQEAGRRDSLSLALLITMHCRATEVDRDHFSSFEESRSVPSAKSPKHRFARRRPRAVGSLIGRGSGRAGAMVLGAIGRGLLGNENQQRYDRPIPAQQIIVRVRVRGGVLVSVVQPVDPNLRTGQRV